MRSNRIIEQTKGGYTKYYPQYQWLFLWFIPMWIYYSEGTTYEWFWEEDEARAYIKLYQEAKDLRTAKVKRRIIYV